MRQINVQWLNLLTETPLITRLQEFNDTPAGVAAFLDELESREIKIPMLTRVPNLAEYGRPLTRYLLFLHEIDSSMILVPHVHDEVIGERVRIDVKLDPLQTTDAIRVTVSHYTPTGGRYYEAFTIHLPHIRNPVYDYTADRVTKVLGYTPSCTRRWISTGPAMQNLPRQPI